MQSESQDVAETTVSCPKNISHISPLLLFSRNNLRISLVVQWLRLCTPNAGDTGSIPGWGTKIPHAIGHDLNFKKE